ncbi:MAG TPA: DNA alkylation repair protein [Candidatus Acidoferrales bacterium]|nr:DNA alkylation repair protein [Candidatus Acidoferrales bacterium]
MEPESLPGEVEGLAREIQEKLRGLADKNTEEIRAVRREFSKRLQNAPPQVVKELATLLLELPGIEYRFFGCELIHYHQSALHKLNSRELEQLGRGIASWPAADCFGIFLAGPLWRERRIPSSLIRGWARSTDRWWRRIALVSTVPLNSKARGGEGDARRTLQVCRILERDRDATVVKALSWALRDLAKRQPRAVRAYLAERGAALSPLVVREVRNKLETGRKNPGRRTKRK